MRLSSFTVSNYRSITEAKKVSLTDYSVLVGANNEGKSNILHALALGMRVLEDFQYSIRKDSLGRIISSDPSVQFRRIDYVWSRDFPISKQRRSAVRPCTEITLEFNLSQAEIGIFPDEVGSKSNGVLPILIRLSSDSREVTIPKQGPGSKMLNRRANKIADFVSRNLRFDYIPAIRTSDNAEGIISSLLERELLQVERHPDYKEAMDKVYEIQAPILKELSESITKTVASFLPSVRSVEIGVKQESRFRAFRNALTIEVDDGDRTLLSRKGDGVKSLVALALMRHVSGLGRATASSIIAVEEPEAHLHPQAIHELREVLIGLSSSNQVILTSHSPLFVDPAKLENTIVVKESKAAGAKSIAEIREVLGVRLSDNLQSARLVCIVEGEDDEIILRAYLEANFPQLKDALANHDLVFDPLGGASNLSYKVRTYRHSATMVQCFLDNDDAGTKGVKRALDESVLLDADYNLIIVEGQTESELEDLLDPRTYREAFIEAFQVDPAITPPSAKGKKWSEAMQKKFSAHGKLWDDQLEMKVKLWLANHVSQSINDHVYDARIGPVVAFAQSLLRKLRLD
jgi:predicted ATP-binding protein involved in virulence